MRVIRSSSGLGLLIVLLAPFVVGFDVHDSTGAHIQVSGGRGAYSYSTCHGRYDKEFVEGNASVRATFAHREEGTHVWARLQPARTTFSASVNYAVVEVTTVLDEAGDPPVGDDRDTEYAFASVFKTTFDWTWIGLEAGLLGHSGVDFSGQGDVPPVLPVGGARLGPEYLFASAQFASAVPLYSGGSVLMGGVGGRLGSTRLWAGMGAIPYDDQAVILKASQDLGRVRLFGAAQVAMEEAGDASRLGREGGFSLGLEAALPPWR